MISLALLADERLGFDESHPLALGRRDQIHPGATLEFDLPLPGAGRHLQPHGPEGAIDRAQVQLGPLPRGKEGRILLAGSAAQ